MKKYILVYIMLQGFTVYSQEERTAILRQIENNNTTLQVLKQEQKADNMEHKTGLFLDNPELGLNYLWGAPSGIGNRTDFSIQQSFDFPTAYRYRRSIADARISQSEIKMDAYLLRLRLETMLLCNGLVFHNQRINELTIRLQHASKIANAYSVMMEAGETNQLELNKAQLNLINAKLSIKKEESEQSMLLEELARLNGGQNLVYTSDIYATSNLASTFDDWFSDAQTNTPQLRYIQQEAEIRQHEIQLSKAMGLPRFSAGYLSEKTMGEQFQGISVGLSIPIWENKNKVKFAKAKAEATTLGVEDVRLQFYHQLKALYQKAQDMQALSNEYRKALKDLNNTTLLNKAFANGELSLMNYMLELSLYYDTVNKWMEAELDFQNTLSELRVYENF